MVNESQKGNFKAYIEILRPGWWLSCFFIGLAPGMLAILWNTGSLNDFLQWHTLIWVFAYWCSIVGIYVYNDIVGIEEDLIVNPKRPMPLKRINKTTALIYSLILVLIGIGLWWYAFENFLSSLIQLSCMGTMIIYSAVYKNNILLGIAAGLIPIGIWIALAPFSTIAIALFLILFFWESTLDVPENLLHYDGDIKVHPHTFAISLGQEKFAQFGIIFALPAVISTLWLFVLLDLSWIFLAFALIAGICLIYGSVIIRNNLAPRQLGQSLGLSMFFIMLINFGLIAHSISQVL